MKLCSASAQSVIILVHPILLLNPTLFDNINLIVYCVSRNIYLHYFAMSDSLSNQTLKHDVAHNRFKNFQNFTSIGNL